MLRSSCPTLWWSDLILLSLLQEQAQVEAIRQYLAKEDDSKANSDQGTHPMDRDFEGGFGGQEDLEDRYATTSGEH